MKKYKSQREHIQKNIRIDGNNCWVWQRYLNQWGYGRTVTKWNGKRRQIMAHRYSLLVFRGKEVPKGMCIDHLCRNQACVNPAHLEIVTMAENNRRNPNWAGNIKDCKHCGKRLGEKKSGGRICYPCTYKYQKEYRKRVI